MDIAMANGKKITKLLASCLYFPFSIMMKHINGKSRQKIFADIEIRNINTQFLLLIIRYVESISVAKVAMKVSESIDQIRTVFEAKKTSKMLRASNG